MLLGSTKVRVGNGNDWNIGRKYTFHFNWNIPSRLPPDASFTWHQLLLKCKMLNHFRLKKCPIKPWLSNFAVQVQMETFFLHLQATSKVALLFHKAFPRASTFTLLYNLFCSYWTICTLFKCFRYYIDMLATFSTNCSFVSFIISDSSCIGIFLCWLLFLFTSANHISFEY